MITKITKSCNDFTKNAGTNLTALYELSQNDWFDFKHGKPSKSEVIFANSIKPKKCPKCGSVKFIKSGLSSSTGYQRYLCKSCDKRFTIFTGTLFDSHKISIADWFQFIMHIKANHTIKSAAKFNRNNRKTSFYRLDKLFLATKDIQNDVVLSGNVYLDETYISVISSKVEKKDGKKLRGLSSNQCCIATAFDGLNLLCFYIGKAKPTMKKILETFKDHIKENSTLIHDGEKSHKLLIGTLKLESKVYKTAETKGLEDDVNPLNKINKIHARLKEFLRAHKGFDRDNLQEWLNVFVFKRQHLRDEDISKKGIEILLSCPEVYRYRYKYGPKMQENT